MTALCGGGPSQALPNVGPIVTLSSVGIAAFITPIVGPVMADLLAPIIGALIDISVNNYCGTDPPPDPGLTQQDVQNALTIPPIGATFAAQAKILQWFEHRYWWQICECSGSTVTPPPPTPSNPGGANSNPGLPSGNTTPACWSVNYTLQIAAGGPGGTNPVTLDTNSRTIPVSSGSSIPTAHGGAGQLAWAMPSGISNLSMTLTLAEPLHSSQFVEAGVVTVTSADTVTGGLEPQLFTGQGLTKTVTAATTAANSAYWFAFITNGDDIPHTVTVQFSFYCSGEAPTGLQTPCCPPDPLLEGKLDLIIQLIQAIQNPTPKTSWTDGATHSALSGNGSFAFVGKPTGIRFNVTTPPANPDVIPGNPNFYWNMGFVTPIALATPLRGARLVYLSESFELPIQADSMGYTLLDGTIANATELLPA